MIDITNASRPILKKKMAECKTARVQYVEMPVAYDALTVVVNPKNDWSETMTVAELKRVWDGRSGQNHQVEPDKPGLA